MPTLDSHHSIEHHREHFSRDFSGFYTLWKRQSHSRLDTFRQFCRARRPCFGRPTCHTRIDHGRMIPFSNVYSKCPGWFKSPFQTLCWPQKPQKWCQKFKNIKFRAFQSLFWLSKSLVRVSILTVFFIIEKHFPLSWYIWSLVCLD